jgi:hypothetical protein
MRNRSVSTRDEMPLTFFSAPNRDQ